MKFELRGKGVAGLNHDHPTAVTMVAETEDDHTALLALFRVCDDPGLMSDFFQKCLDQAVLDVQAEAAREDRAGKFWRGRKQ